MSCLALRCPRTLPNEITRGILRRAFATEAPKSHRLAVAILLNRAPFLTRDPTPFEEAFYEYQQKIQRALHNPFPNDFYFKEGSLLEAKFVKEEIDRDRAAFGEDIVEGREIPNEALLEKETDQTEPLAPKQSAADVSNDLRSLDRKGSRNLYLLLKSSEGKSASWRFPKGYIQPGELLHEAAKRRLHEECGEGMNTWIVGRRPVGYTEIIYEQPKDQYTGEKVFFFKGHIFAGQVKPQNSSISDFVWLTKEEMQPQLSRDYWERTKDMLSDF